MSVYSQKTRTVAISDTIAVLRYPIMIALLLVPLLLLLLLRYLIMSAMLLVLMLLVLVLYYPIMSERH